MLKAKAGLVGLASRFESGGERAEAILPALMKALEKNGVDVVPAGKVVWDMADAVEVAEQMARSDVDALVLAHLSWVQDSVQYILQTTVNKPALLWSVPYAETFSMACVQHFGSVLASRGAVYEYASGLPEDAEPVAKAVYFARAAAAAAKLKDSFVGMIGPRQTWRIAGPQDTTQEEWDFTEQFGLRIVHIETEELRGEARAVSGADAHALLNEKRAAYPAFAYEAEDERLLYAAKIYLAAKRLYARYSLTAAGAQCYPMNGGITNLASAWLADEGTVLDTEGDIGHTALLLLMNGLGGGLPAALAETGKVDAKNDCIHLVHEGSSAMSLSGGGGVVQAAADEGTAVGFRLKEMKELTAAGLCGFAGKYRMLLAKAASLGVDERDWLDAGRKFHGCLRFPVPAADAFDAMMRMGADHHLVVKPGDCLAELRQFCRIAGVEALELPARNE